MEPGDALLHSRYCYHRGERFSSAHSDAKLRYSIRYMPESARLFNNGFEGALKAKSGCRAASRSLRAASTTPRCGRDRCGVSGHSFGWGA